MESNKLLSLGALLGTGYFLFCKDTTTEKKSEKSRKYAASEVSDTKPVEKKAPKRSPSDIVTHRTRRNRSPARSAVTNLTENTDYDE